MSRLIKILHVDPDFKVTYFIYGPGSSIRTPVPLQTAIELLKKVDFDLILSEPHNKAILKKEDPVIKTKPITVEQPIGEGDYGYFGEVRANRYSETNFRAVPEKYLLMQR